MSAAARNTEPMVTIDLAAKRKMLDALPNINPKLRKVAEQWPLEVVAKFCDDQMKALAKRDAYMTPFGEIKGDGAKEICRAFGITSIESKKLVRRVNGRFEFNVDPAVIRAHARLEKAK